MASLTARLAPPDHQKLCYSALILAMVFSMGEAVPCAHYGKKARRPEPAGARTLTCGDGVSGRGSRKCRERVGAGLSLLCPLQSTWARPSPSSC